MFGTTCSVPLLRASLQGAHLTVLLPGKRAAVDTGVACASLVASNTNSLKTGHGLKILQVPVGRWKGSVHTADCAMHRDALVIQWWS